MAPKRNPLRLNPLQLKTLTILQELARAEEVAVADEATGDVLIAQLPRAHGDHFHVGRAVVAARDASGLVNQGVWRALERKGLARDGVFPMAITLTRAGLDYETGLRQAILHGLEA